MLFLRIRWLLIGVLLCQVEKACNVTILGNRFEVFITNYKVGYWLTVIVSKVTKRRYCNE